MGRGRAKCMVFHCRLLLQMGGVCDASLSYRMLKPQSRSTQNLRAPKPRPRKGSRHHRAWRELDLGPSRGRPACEPRPELFPAHLRGPSYFSYISYSYYSKHSWSLYKGHYTLTWALQAFHALRRDSRSLRLRLEGLAGFA